MKTYIIKSEKDLEKFKDDYGYYIDGNAKFEYSADFTGRLKVDGYLEVKAGWSIKAGGYIEAGGYIKAGGSYGISAGLQITCKDELKFGLKCFAGICTWRKISDEEKTITCGKFSGGVVEYGILKETGNSKKSELLSKADELIKKAEELKAEAENL